MMTRLMTYMSTMITLMPRTLGDWTFVQDYHSGGWCFEHACDELQVYATPWWEDVAGIAVQYDDSDALRIPFEPTHDASVDVARYCSLMGGFLPIIRQRMRVARALDDLSSAVDRVESVHAPSGWQCQAHVDAAAGLSFEDMHESPDDDTRSFAERDAFVAARNAEDDEDDSGTLFGIDLDAEDLDGEG